MAFKKVDELSHNVDFYTVRLGNKELTEFEFFVNKDFPDHEEEIEILYNTIDIIGERGAKIRYFKSEGPANALPKVSKPVILSNEQDFGIRLYCVRLTDYLVVLLNGDIKTTLNPKDCPRVAKHFVMLLLLHPLWTNLEVIMK